MSRYRLIRLAAGIRVKACNDSIRASTKVVQLDRRVKSFESGVAAIYQVENGCIAIDLPLLVTWRRVVLMYQLTQVAPNFYVLDPSDP